MTARGLVALAAAGLLLLTGCSSGGDDDGKAPAKAQEGTLRVLAGSELADLAPILEQARKATGVRVVLDYAPTIDGVQQVMDGKAQSRYEAIWFSSNRYLALRPGAQARLGTATKTMSSPVVLGLRASVASRLGWDSRRPTWADIAKAAGERRFTYGMTSPAASNSGFSALVAVAAALSGSGSALDVRGIERVAPHMKRFFAAQTLTAGSSGWLSDAYARQVTSGQGPAVDGLINYESVLLSLNAAGKLPEPLTLIYPGDGVITADYPITLLASAPDHARTSYQRLTDYLRRPEVQRQIADRTHRRPIAGAGGSFPVAPPELPFPATSGAVDALIVAYYDEYRRPSRTIYVLDVSGSMKGDRIEGLRSALVALTGADTSLSGTFQRFHNREEVTLIPFNGKPRPPRSYTVPEQSPEAELGRIRSYAQGLAAEGGTAVYDSLLQAYQVARAAGGSDRFTSIVLMSDGESNAGAKLDDFLSRHRSLPPEARAVPVFPILFGESANDEMNRVAEETGGRTFDARSQSLATVFREIRGYQ